jgi:hypothetical protein
MARRRKPVVTQHLEKASARLLEKHQDVLREYIKGKHGVYALYKGERLYYVGLGLRFTTAAEALCSRSGCWTLEPLQLVHHG